MTDKDVVIYNPQSPQNPWLRGRMWPVHTTRLITIGGDACVCS